jgi:hypothetical protein
VSVHLFSGARQGDVSDRIAATEAVGAGLVEHVIDVGL